MPVDKKAEDEKNKRKIKDENDCQQKSIRKSQTFGCKNVLFVGALAIITYFLFNQYNK